MKRRRQARGFGEGHVAPKPGELVDYPRCHRCGGRPRYLGPDRFGAEFRCGHCRLPWVQIV